MHIYNYAKQMLFMKNILILPCAWLRKFFIRVKSRLFFFQTSFLHNRVCAWPITFHLFSTWHYLYAKEQTMSIQNILARKSCQDTYNVAQHEKLA
jgi:hypothetical protein